MSPARHVHVAPGAAHLPPEVLRLLDTWLPEQRWYPVPAEGVTHEPWLTVTFPGVAHDIYGRYGEWMSQTVPFFEETVVAAMDPSAPDPGTGHEPAPEPAPPATPVPATPRYTG